MQRTRRYRLLTAILLVLAASAAAAPQGEYYGSGYTIISQEHGNDDLQATVYRQLTPGTVGQALPQLLDGTGWRLADSHAADDRVYRLYNQPLPEHKLRIGPMPLDQALTWIAGDGWALVVDPVNRLVSFEVEARYDSRPPVGIHSRPAATSHAPDVAPAATPVYADLPPQGSFPAVQTAPDYTNTTYRTPTAAYPVPPRESWQNALPQRLADNARAPQPPREQRRSKTRKAVRPAVTVADDKTTEIASRPHHSGKTDSREDTAARRTTAATAPKAAAAAPATKITSAKTRATAADKEANKPAAKGAASESRPAAAPHPATPSPDKADKKTVAPAENRTTPEGNKTATPATANAEKTPSATGKTAEKAAAPAGHKKAAESSQADSPATAKPAADATAKPVPAATQPAAPAKAAPAPAKSEAPAPVLANPAKADGAAPAAAKPATAQDTAAQAKPAAAPENPATAPVKTGYLPGPPPALIAKRTIHVPPQQRLRPPAAPAVAATPEDAP